jgi:hypothetical protein
MTIEITAASPKLAPASLGRIADTLGGQMLALEQLKELVQFIGAHEHYQSDPNPWLAIGRYLDSISDEIGGATHNLEQLAGAGAS